VQANPGNSSIVRAKRNAQVYAGCCRCVDSLGRLNYNSGLSTVLLIGMTRRVPI